MLERGHRVAALFGYDRITDALRPDDLRPLGPRFAEPDAVDRYPLNPFLKTELVRRNPNGLPGVEAWRELVDGKSLMLLDEHLGAL